MLPDGYLDELVATDRLTFWSDRFNESAPERRVVVKATRDSVLAGFACVLLDAEPAWGARLDNLHVRPQLKGEGIWYALFQAARHWIAQQMPEGSMHLWVVEQNYAARRFYERQGGAIAERLTRHVALDLSVPELRYLWPVGEML
jgi:GNAT superfamily N-acetyltransferase